MTEGFVPPPYPYDRLDPLRVVAESLPGGTEINRDNHAEC